MINEYHSQEQALQINDQTFKELYLEGYEDYEGPEKHGACMQNAANVAEYLVEQGASRDNLQFLFIASPTIMGPEPLEPNVDTLREEEQKRAEAKGGKIKWEYHAAIITKDTKQVYDLSSDRKNWGLKLDDYMIKTFVDDRGFVSHNLRFIVTTLDSLEEIVEKREGIEITELTKRGQEVGRGMSSVWMLQNKPEEEWFWG